MKINNHLVVIIAGLFMPAMILANPQVVDLSQNLDTSSSQPQMEASNNNYQSNAPQTQSPVYTENPDAAGSSTDNMGSEQLSLPAPANEESYPSNTSDSGMSTEQRLQRLEQQLQNFANLNLPQQISQLQQQVQQLSGTVQQQSHEIKMLSAKLHQNKVDDAASINKSSSEPSLPAHLSANNPPVTSNTDDDALSEDDANYQHALSLLNNKQYSPAEAAFNQYLKSYPQGKFAANAHYWLGELYLSDKNLFAAANEFSHVVQQPGTSGKAADARLKLAMIHIQQGQTQTARTELKQIQQQYPNTTAAHLADIQFQQLNLATPK